MFGKKRILLKVTGEIFCSTGTKTFSNEHLIALIQQIKQLHDTHQFGIVVGGGNIFRGDIQGKQLGMRASMSHYAGMLATMINGIAIQDLLEQHNMPARIFSALNCPEIGAPIMPTSIEQAVDNAQTLIFTGGTGNPFFTTDTNAVLRALQMHATAVWKATNVDGVYTADPKRDGTAQKIDTLTYAHALQMQLGIMDSTAFALAQKNGMPIKIFNIFDQDALLKAAHDDSFGSLIQ